MSPSTLVSWVGASLEHGRRSLGLALLSSFYETLSINNGLYIGMS